MQIGYPVSTSARVDWTTLPGGTTGLELAIDDPEGAIDTADGITCFVPTIGGGVGIESGTVTFSYTTSLQDPLTDSNHALFLVADASGAGNHDIKVELQAGGFVTQTTTISVNPARPAEQFSIALSVGSWTSGAYSTIKVRLATIIGAADWRANVYLARLRIPNVGFRHVDIDPGGVGFKEVAIHYGYYLLAHTSGVGFVRMSGEDTPGACIIDTSGPLRLK